MDEYRGLLSEGRSTWEMLMNPAELFAEIAAIYEVCYGGARRAQQQGRRQPQEDATPADAHGRPAVVAHPSGVVWRIRFVWRLAHPHLKRMKEYAKQIEAEA